MRTPSAAIKFPQNEEVVRCPHCHGNCAFSVEDRSLNYIPHDERSKPRRESITFHLVKAAFCRTCGGPIICHSRMTDSAGDETAGPYGGGRRREEQQVAIYPTVSRRGTAPQEVRQEDADLADLFDKAVACEPLSGEAAMTLLGRCMERILVKRTGVSRGGTLGQMIPAAISSGRVPDALQDVLKSGFLLARNQGSHWWEDAQGNELKITDEHTDECFCVVRHMFEHFYIAPARRNALMVEMAKVKGSRA